MAVMISPSVMRLGVIERDGELYMAYLHYRDDKGIERAITDEMKKAQGSFAKLWQNAVKTLDNRVQVAEFYENGYEDGEQGWMQYENETKTAMT